MSENRKKIEFTGIKPVDILLPNESVDLSTWSVVACDQYTSEPEYWKICTELVGDAPSTLNIIFPEVYLGKDDQARIDSINSTMNEYKESGIFTTYPDSFFLVKRTTPVCPEGRWGLIAGLDLEEYDYSPDSVSLIRATEGTILDRIPPRKMIRNKAPMELPHILVLIDDPLRSVIEPLADRTDKLECVYSFDLMQNGGTVSAYRISRDEDFAQISDALKKLSDPAAYEKKYGNSNVMLYAMGDGNHSLATAKSCWEDIKKSGEFSEQELSDHPARFALVEIENIFDPGIIFEPIHRVLFHCPKTQFLSYLDHYCSSYAVEKVSGAEEIMKKIQGTSDHSFGLATDDGFEVVRVHKPQAEIAAGTLQLTIDEMLQQQAVEIDYTHGLEVTSELGAKEGNIGIFLPAISKEEFFPAIIKGGVLPRKTFSMGEANEKRYYIEAHAIIRN